MNRRRSRFLLLLASFALVTAGSNSVGAFWGRHVWRTSITPGNAAKLWEGMTLTEVEAVFGGHERREVEIPWTTFICSGGSGGYFLPPYTTRVWASNELIIAVFFRDGRAAGTFRDNHFVAIGQGTILKARDGAITPENAARIRLGMTLAEVEVLLGGASRDELPQLPTEYTVTDDPTEVRRQAVRAALKQLQNAGIAGRDLWGKRFVIWRSEQVFVYIRLDQTQRVDFHDRFLVRTMP